jgi:hypothetical protein
MLVASDLARRVAGIRRPINKRNLEATLNDRGKKAIPD